MLRKTVLIIAYIIVGSTVSFAYTYPEFNYGFSCKDGACNLYILNSVTFEKVEFIDGSFKYDGRGSIQTIIPNFQMKLFYILRSFTGGGRYQLLLFDVDKMSIVESEAEKLDLFPNGYKLSKDGKWLYYSTNIHSDKYTDVGTYMFDAANLKVNKMITDWFMFDGLSLVDHSFMTEDGNYLLVKSHDKGNNNTYNLIDINSGEIIKKILLGNKLEASESAIVADYRKGLLLVAVIKKDKNGKVNKTDIYEYNLENENYSNHISVDGYGLFYYLNDTDILYNKGNDINDKWVTKSFEVYNIKQQKLINKFEINANDYLEKIKIGKNYAYFVKNIEQYALTKDEVTNEYKIHKGPLPLSLGDKNKPATPTTPPGQEKKQ